MFPACTLSILRSKQMTSSAPIRLIAVLFFHQLHTINSIPFTTDTIDIYKMSRPSPPSLIHLDTLTFSDLPPHSALDESPSRPHHISFLTTLLVETTNFLDSTIPSFTADPKQRPASPSLANVQLSSSCIPHTFSRSKKGTGKEYWVCRKSRHANKAIAGSASYQEFREGLRTNHSEHEMEYTPTVSSVEKILEWETVECVEGGWRDVSMHGIFPISPSTYYYMISVLMMK